MAVAAAGLALARLLRQPPVLGYLLAGLIIGPFTLPHPVIGNRDTIELLAELGLVLPALWHRAGTGAGGASAKSASGCWSSASLKSAP